MFLKKKKLKKNSGIKNKQSYTNRALKASNSCASMVDSILSG